MRRGLVLAMGLLGMAADAGAEEPGSFIQVSGTTLSLLVLVGLLGLVRLGRHRR